MKINSVSSWFYLQEYIEMQLNKTLNLYNNNNSVHIC